VDYGRAAREARERPARLLLQTLPPYVFAYPFEELSAFRGVPGRLFVLEDHRAARTTVIWLFGAQFGDRRNIEAAARPVLHDARIGRTVVPTGREGELRRRDRRRPIFLLPRCGLDKSNADRHQYDHSEDNRGHPIRHRPPLSQ
jgi:hypothetical protein